ncbi:uncharacterized protein PHACADRAFT_96522 [Phanerochaete carnosa HHB-10118-sp]|uniref:non-specific serine/threonine protein kinase n=1 Tax=Phanerochaete carnosa (strain HHB-10118-sp) TaxID=650164 RepID=K5VTK9_PHACS|nr:uncharacterized protein PHACADRAFT_96522 [Phanerochaete carnosa HHB-10118-sp]EKM54813.1 hypothetical protein PHACADRAFT_96522 [Phanerochaete carnosa HHB-10118-sp]
MASFISYIPLLPNILAFLGWRTDPEHLPDYYPARRHEKLKKRYRVETRLGSGVWSNTWLVSDTAAPKSRRFYAIKILTLDATSEHRAGVMLELEIMKKVRDGGPMGHLPTLIDDFEIPRPRGNYHICLVMEVYGQDVATFRRSSPNKALPVHTVKVIVKQVLQGVIRLHELGIVHTDIKPDNMLFHTEMSPEAIEKWLGTLPADPSDACYPLPADFKWDDPPERVKDMRITLTDLGQSQHVGPVGEQTVKQFSAYSLRAPEVILRSDFGAAIDIWAIGCIVFEMLSGRWLFHPESGDEDFSLEDDHLAKMMELTGERFSSAMLQRAQLAQEYFDSRGDLLRVSELYRVELKHALANYKTIPEDQLGPAASFIQGCIHLEPADRPSAVALLNHPWLQDM